MRIYSHILHVYLVQKVFAMVNCTSISSLQQKERFMAYGKTLLHHGIFEASVKSPSLDHHDVLSSSCMPPYPQVSPAIDEIIVMKYMKNPSIQSSTSSLHEVQHSIQMLIQPWTLEDLTSSFHLTLYLRFLSSFSSLLLTSSCPSHIIKSQQ